ncbi:MAG: 3D domain-containing protein, partial [Polyangia bacterium]
LAVDPSVYPLGTLLFLRPRRGFADGDGTAGRVAVAMDTGAAIKGPGRIDVYFGDDGVTTAQAVAQGSVEGEAYVLLGR